MSNSLKKFSQSCKRFFQKFSRQQEVNNENNNDNDNENNEIRYHHPGMPLHKDVEQLSRIDRQGDIRNRTSKHELNRNYVVDTVE